MQTTQEHEREDVSALRIDYEQTTAYFHALAEIRFKLLALLPIATGAAMAFLRHDRTEGAAIALGLLGFLASLGLLFYDQRNTELYDRMQRRAKILEAELGFIPFFREEDQEAFSLGPSDVKIVGGAFLDRPRRGKKLWFVIPMWHDLGLAIVYSAILAGWTYIVADAAVRLMSRRAVLDLDTTHAFGIAALVGSAVFIGLVLLDDPTDEQSSLPVHYRRKIWGPKALEEAPPQLKSYTLALGTGGGVGCLGLGLLIPVPPLWGFIVGSTTGVLLGIGTAWYIKRTIIKGSAG